MDNRRHLVNHHLPHFVHVVIEGPRGSQFYRKIGVYLDNVGYQVWRGALFMADFALDNQKLFENQNILEIGAGTGLSSIILSNHCKTKEVFVTDLPDLLPLLKGVRL